MLIPLGQVIAPFDPNAVELGDRLLPPSDAHLFGTDSLGRDVYSRVLYGVRLSLPTGVLVVLFAVVIGTAWGSISAYVGGRTEGISMRIADVVLAFPALILAMAIAAALGIGVANAIIAMVVVWWPRTHDSHVGWCSSSATRSTSRPRACSAIPRPRSSGSTSCPMPPDR